jgi:serine/threonine protein kinase
MFELPGGDYVRDPITPQFGTAISDVYKGRNVETNQIVAIKVMRMVSNNDDEPDKYKRVRSSELVLLPDVPNSLGQMFRKEAIVWRLLEHRYIVPFFGILGGSSSVELVSEWMEHGRLTKYLKDNVQQSPLPFVCFRPCSSGSTYLQRRCRYDRSLKDWSTYMLLVSLMAISKE